MPHYSDLLPPIDPVYKFTLFIRGVVFFLEKRKADLVKCQSLD